MSTEALALSYDDAPALLREFTLPLVRGEAVRISDPVSDRVYWDYVGALTARSRSMGALTLELQRRARRLLSEPPLLELQTSDLQLTVVAYTWCWLFHPIPEDRRLWERRLENLIGEMGRLLEQIPPPEDAAQALTRHLLLRHLTRLYREDTRVAFPFLWRPLEFKGTEPRWVRFPGRGGVPQTTRLQLVRATQRPTQQSSAGLLEGILQRDPLTRLLSAELLYPAVTFTGTLPTLAIPSLCRLVTHAWVDSGLPRLVAPLAVAFTRFLDDPAEPLPQKRYLAKFLYNLALTWCAVRDLDTLSLPMTLPSEQLRRDVTSTGRTTEAWAATFVQLIAALHAHRAALGAAHLTAGDPALQARVEAFLGAPPPDPERARVIQQRLLQHLQLRAP